MSEVIPDIAGLIGCYVAIALLTILTAVLVELEQAGNFSLSIPHVKTFHINVGTWIFGGLINALNNAQKSLQHWAVRFQNDIVTMFEVLVALPILAAEGSYKGLQALWTVMLDKALSPALASIRSSIAAAAGRADTVYNAIYNTSTALPSKVASAISSAANGAYANAKSYTDALRSDVTAGLKDAKGYTDSAVAGLRKAEDAAVAAASDLAASAKSTAERDFATAEADAKGLVSDAVSSLTDLVNRAVAAGESVASGALSGAVSSIQSQIAAVDQAANTGIAAARGDLSAALADARASIESELAAAVGPLSPEIDAAKAAALAAVDAASSRLEALIRQAEDLAESEVGGAAAVASTALSQVRAIAIGAEQDLQTLEGPLGVAGLAALLGTIPALATLVHTLAQETGLENESCRGKVKNICQTDPAAWVKLLSGAAFLTLAFDFEDFVKGAQLVATGIGDGVAELEKPFNLSIPPLELAA